MSLSKPSAMLSDAIGTLLVRISGIALIFVSTTLTARLLGPDEFGAYSAALALALSLATLAPLGSDRILAKNLSFLKSEADIGQETAITHVGTAWIVAIMCCGLTVAWLFSNFVLQNQSWARTSFLAAIMFIPLTSIYLRQWLAIPLIGARRAVMPEQTVLPVIFASSLLLSSAVGFRLTATVTAIAYSTAASVVLIFSLRSKSLRTAYQSALRHLPELRWSCVVRRMIEGLSYVAVAVAVIISQTSMPLMIAATCGFTESAYYALAMPFGALPGIPLGVFTLTMFPRCARLYQAGQMAEANHTVRSAATIMFGLSIGIGLVVWMCSPLLIVLLGTEYLTVCRLLPMLLLAAIVDSLTGPTIPVMQTMKMERPYSALLFASIPVQLCLIYVLGRIASVEGAALGFLLSRLLWNITVMLMIRRMRGLTMLPYLKFRLAWHEFSESQPQLSRPEFHLSPPELTRHMATERNVA